MAEHELLLRRVRSFAHGTDPDEPEVAERAVLVASAACDGGRSACEAYALARTYVLCRGRHPAHRKARSDVVVDLADAL